MSWITKANLGALLLGLVLSFLLAEGLLRLHPPAILNDDVYNFYDPEVGWLPLPNEKAKKHLDCLYITPIHFNTLGFRDGEWTDTGEFTIGIIGDSFMAATVVPEGLYPAAVLEKLVGYRVLNGGVENFGTINEYLAFKKHMLRYKPQLVILSFTLYNDVVDNSYKLRKRWDVNPELWPSASIDERGAVRIYYPNVSDVEKISLTRNFLKRHCKVCLLAERIRQFLNVQKTYIYDSGSRKLKYHEIYLPEDDDWREGWKLTEYFLDQLKQTINSYGGKFLIVLPPDYLNLSNTWEKELKDYTGVKEIPSDFSLDRPLIHLRQVAERTGLPLFELEPFMKGYVNAHDLAKRPFLSYKCDGHYNPLGDFLYSNFVARYVLENNLVPMDEAKKSRTLEKIENNLKRDPQTILTANGYQRIYRDETFYGQTNILQILSAK
jgi:hypothetical protein